jgi:hypothetical protein
VAQRDDSAQPGSIGDELAEAIRRQVDQVAEALRDEVERLQQEVSERGRAAARGAGYVGAAGALGLVAGGALASLPLIALRKVLPPTAVALLVAGGAAAGAFVLARRGLEQLKVAAPESVEQRLDEAGDEIADTLRAQARQAHPKGAA